LFWAFHIAHALIYGVVAVLWKFLLRPPKNADSGGPEAAHIILSTAVRQAMSRTVHANNLKSTGCLSGKIPDVTRYAAGLTPSESIDIMTQLYILAL
jgi:hypothetical protein